MDRYMDNNNQNTGGGSGGPQNSFQQQNPHRIDRLRDNKLNRDQASQHWSIIRDAIFKIYAQKASTLSYEELYRTGYYLVLYKHGEMLYDNVKKTTVELLQPIAQRLINVPEEELLKEITSVWALEKEVIIMIKDILLYMDKNFVPKMKNSLNVQDMQISQFKTHVVLNTHIKQKLVQLLLQEVEKERNGGQIERLFVQKAIEMLIEVGMSSRRIYEQEFEAILIGQTRDYYRNESNNFISDNSCTAYLMKANNRLTEEQDRVNSYLHPSSHDKIITEFLKEYIEAHAATLLQMQNSGLVSMLQQSRLPDIKLMYSLFKRCPAALNALKYELKNYIVAEGQKFIRNDSISNEDLIRQIIEFREKMADLLAKSLDRDSQVEMTIKGSFENFINESDKTAKALVVYLDDQFKKDFKNDSEQVISEKVDKIIQIFRYLQDKDIFENFYKSFFAKRLLDSRRVLEDAEKEVIKKLKEECGYNFTQRLEVMFKDIKMSEQRIIEFQKSQLAQQLKIELSVKVLTTGHWPNESRDPTAQHQQMSTIEQVQLPQEIRQSMSVYKQYYMSKFSGRQLYWKLNQGHAEIRAKIGNNGTKKYEITVSTYQMCILLLFNERAQLSYHELLQLMQITDNDMKSHLIPLCQFKILNKSPKGTDFKMEDSYKVNFQFYNDLIKIKVPVMHSKAQKNQEAADLSSKVEDDRKHVIDATVVKVMKARKKIDHNSLIAESTKILSAKFNPDPLLIKKRIEGLIDREYMEKDKEDKRFYLYIA